MSATPSPTQESKELRHALESARLGSADIVGQILEKYRPYLLLVAKARFDDELHGKAGVSDIVQETLIEANRGIEEFEFRSRRGLRGWLRRILLHNLADFRKRFRGTARRTVSGDISPRLADPGPSPSAELVVREELDRVRRALERLPEEQRAVILLRGQQNLSFAEIGQRLGRSEDAVRMLYRRGIEKLRRDVEGAS